MPSQTQETKEILKQYGLKATHQRIAVLSILANTKEHPSAEMIMNSLKEKDIHMSFATVYNVLETFVQVGLIQKLSDGGEIMRFDYNTDFHVHLYDITTGEIDDLHDIDFCDYITQYVKDNIQNNDNIHKIDLIVQTRS